MRRSKPFLPAVLGTFLLAGCIPGLVHDRGARDMATAPEGAWPIHATSDRAHWLLRGSPGWVAAHQAGFGLLNAGEAVAVVRVVLFSDPATAAAGFERLTPDYLLRSFPVEVGAPPWEEPLKTEAPVAQVTAYMYFVAVAPYVPSPFPARLIKLRHGRAVALLAGIGLSDVQFAAGIAAVAREAELLDEE